MINALEGSLAGRGPLGNGTSQHQSQEPHKRQEDGDSPSLLSNSPIISASGFY
ncbi:hypothetical protein KY289_009074 [Solanum tuberosum]|nr:hypothetical protein KY289_009074 [Solanum tuberosum]